MKQFIQDLILNALKNLGIPQVEFNVEEPPKGKLGDYATNVALKASGLAGQSPKQIAEKLVDALVGEKLFQEVKLDGPGFINFTLAHDTLAQGLVQVIEQRDKYGISNVGKGDKVLVEYFQPNVAKPLHLGHLRTAIIGDSLFRILQFAGYKTESDTHIGDWGTQFGLLLYSYKLWGDDTTIERHPVEELNKLYVRINNEIKTNPELRTLGKGEFVKLEQGEKESRKIWKRFVEWSLPEFEKVYSLLGIRRHDHNWSEKFYEDKMPEIIELLKSKDLLEDSQGAKIVNLEGDHLGTAIIIKSDGGSTYLLRDLAAFIFRKRKGFTRQLYVVDVRQEHTFRQMFKILEKMGEYEMLSEKSAHISYGFLSTDKGILSTRQGNRIGPVELVAETEKKVLAIIEVKNPNLPDKKEVARAVAVGAIKYFDLSHNRLSNIVFRWDEVLDFEGNSGPYLQYAHARIKSILRKAGKTSKKADFKKLSADEERRLMVRIARFPEVLESAATAYMPNYVAEYLFTLAVEFNQFYQNVRVLDEADDKLRLARLALISGVALVLKNGLGLLGIEAPEEM